MKKKEIIPPLSKSAYEYIDGCAIPTMYGLGVYSWEAIEAVKITEQEKDIYYQWCVKICCDRIDGIVSGQHRRAYDRAAQTLAACEELRSNICGKNTGESLVTRYLNKYPRHSSFRESVRKILG